MFFMNLLRLLPAVDELQKNEQFTSIKKTYDIADSILTKWLSESIQVIREQILKKEIGETNLQGDSISKIIFAQLEDKVKKELKKNLRPVINATGIVLHTNLGRARLSDEAIQHITKVAKGYSTLEYNLQAGTRGSRHDIVEEYIKKLTGAEAAVVVNNNAAAVYLVLRALAANQEVIVSRGELIEIGGSFRVSEIMAESEAQLVEVGTSNKTHIFDYERAITEETALLMKVHKSNFDIVGFSAEIDTEDLLSLAKKYELPIYEDLGSGTLYDFKKNRIGKEPTVQEKIAAGIDLISFSGDKLLGGPQAGIIVGKKRYIDRLKSHHLARILRVDKFTLAGLEATLSSYIKGKERRDVPTVRDILLGKEEILKRAEHFVERIRVQTDSYNFTIEEGSSKVGGGTMPTEKLTSYVVKVRHCRLNSTELGKRLRELPYPIIVRIQEEQILLDFRTVDEDEVAIVIEAFLEVDRAGRN